MNILLVYPEFPDTFWSFKHALKFTRQRASLPPLGLLTIAAMLPQEWQKRLIDINVEKLKDRDLEWADYVFISAMAVQKKSVREVINRCKAAGVKTVAGGPLFTCEPEKYPGIDHLVLNEAELTLPAFLADLQRGVPAAKYGSTGYCSAEKTPAPLWQLAKLGRYASMSVQFSRGCPFNCEFCNVTSLFGHKPRLKATRQVLSELDSLYQTGWRGNIFFVDDNFIGNKNFLKTNLLPALINWRKGKKGLPFNTEASINLADDPELMKMMVRAGFNTVFIGIETPDEDGLMECSKKQNRNRDLVESVKLIQRTGIEVQAGFIVGFDSDKSSIFQSQIDFIQKSGIVTAMVGLLQAPLGTRLFDRMQKADRIIGEFTGDNVNGKSNIVPLMDSQTLDDGYKKIMRAIYSPRLYFQRIKTLLQEIKAPTISIPLSFSRLTAFIWSTVRLGLLGPERVHYWIMLFRTLTRRPSQLPLAVTLAIYGFHFRRICETYIL